MGLHFNSWHPKDWTYERFSDGDSFLTVGSTSTKYGDKKHKLQKALDSYAVFTCISIIADICSKAKFYKRVSGKLIEDDPLITLLGQPNYLQNGKDFIKQWIWYKLVYGYVPQRPVMPAGRSRNPNFVQAIFNLNPKGIYYDDKFRTPMIFTEQDVNEFKQQTLRYEIKGEKANFEIDGLMFSYDVANGLDDDFLLKSPSKIDAVNKAIGNTDLALDAENVMLQTNGREMFSGGNEKASSGISMPLKAEDRKEIQMKLMKTYGLGKNKVRSIVTSGGVNYQSLHVELKKLGFLESGNHNASIIRSVFQVPETIYKLYDEQGDTFENKKEGQVGFIQDIAQTHIDDMMMTFNNYFGYQKTPLVASFDHLPSMQLIQERKAEKFFKVSSGIRNLDMAGMTSEEINQMLIRFGLDGTKDE